MRQTTTKFAAFIMTILMITPFTTVAGTRLEAPDRPLQGAEKKVGSVYRGCNGFHCLEEASEMRMSLSVGNGCDRESEHGLFGSLEGGSTEVCFRGSTNAREGVILLASSSSGNARVCKSEADDTLVEIGEVRNGCHKVETNIVPIIRSTDDLEDGYAKFRVTTDAPDELVTFITVIAY